MGNFKTVETTEKLVCNFASFGANGVAGEGDRLGLTGVNREKVVAFLVDTVAYIAIGRVGHFALNANCITVEHLFQAVSILDGPLEPPHHKRAEVIVRFGTRRDRISEELDAWFGRILVSSLQTDPHGVRESFFRVASVLGFSR